MNSDFRRTIKTWPFLADGLQATVDLPAGDFEITAVYGTIWWSDSEAITAVDYATRGWPCARGDVQKFKLLASRRIYIYNPAGCDSYVRQVE